MWRSNVSKGCEKAVEYPLRTEPSHTYLMWCHFSCWFYSAKKTLPNITETMELQTTSDSDMCLMCPRTHTLIRTPKCIWTLEAHLDNIAIQVEFIEKFIFFQFSNNFPH